jgi:uncharacterized membrane protein (DUF2068 family)
MKPEFKLVMILLGILVILDVAAVPFMIAANHHTHGTPPGPAIVLAGVIAMATLISAFGVARGLRWAFWVAVTSRIIDAAQNFLGLTNHPTPVTTVGGGLGLVLSLVAIAALVRVNPRRKARVARRLAAASAQASQPEPSNASTR